MQARLAWRFLPLSLSLQHPPFKRARWLLGAAAGCRWMPPAMASAKVSDLRSFAGQSLGDTCVAADCDSDFRRLSTALCTHLQLHLLLLDGPGLLLNGCLLPAHRVDKLLLTHPGVDLRTECQMDQ
eukprot:1829773-Prymnesium_polylepis.1